MIVKTPPVLKLPATRHYKILVISDLHFPRKDSNPKYLLEFLQHNTCDVLILLGDIHEGYDHEIQPFHEMHLRVMDLIAARQAQGMIVIDVPGNHDAYKRQDHILGHRIFGKEYWNNLVVPSCHGGTFLMHGDETDHPLTKQHDKAAYRIAKEISIGKISLIDIRSALETLANKLSGGESKKTNRSTIEEGAASIALSHGCQSVLTGHSHKAANFSPVNKYPEILFGNTGAWVGRISTAMAMDHHQQWRLIKWDDERRGFYAKKPNGITADNEYALMREQSILEVDWHRAQHAVFREQTELEIALAAIKDLSKIKNRLLDFLKAAEARLGQTRKMADGLSSTTPIIKLNTPTINASASPQ